MDQVLEGTPQATVTLSGRRVTRSEVANDWGTKLQWRISRNGKVVATVSARPEASYEHPDKTPGKYEVVLELFKYVNYRKDKKGQYTQSKFIEIAKSVTYTIPS